MAQQIPVGDQALYGFEIPDEAVWEFAPDLAYRRLAMVANPDRRHEASEDTGDELPCRWQI